MRRSLVIAMLVVLAWLLFASQQSVVQAQCGSSSISSFSISPSGTVDQGTGINVYGRGNCGTSRITANGEPKAELGAPELSTTIRTEEFPAGSLQICYQLRDDNDGGWDNAERRCDTVQVRGVNAPPPQTQPPQLPQNPQPPSQSQPQPQQPQSQQPQSQQTQQQQSPQEPQQSQPQPQQVAHLDYGASEPIGDRSLRVIAGNGLNIRSGPGTDYPIIGRTVFGAYFAITGGPEGNWYKIRFNGGEGWVSAQWVELAGATTPQNSDRILRDIKPSIRVKRESWSDVPMDIREGLGDSQIDYSLAVTYEELLGGTFSIRTASLAYEPTVYGPSLACFSTGWITILDHTGNVIVEYHSSSWSGPSLLGLSREGNLSVQPSLTVIEGSIIKASVLWHCISATDLLEGIDQSQGGSLEHINDLPDTGEFSTNQFSIP